MPPKRKGFGFKKSHIDDTLYQLMYYAWSNKVSIQLKAQAHAQIKKNDIFAIVNQEGIQNILKFPFSGQVLDLPDIPLLNESEVKNVVLCNFRLCDHEPKPMKTQNEKDHCIHCGEVLWYYYSKHIIQYSVLQIQNKMEINLHSENVNFEWTVIRNESFTHQTQLARIQDRKLILDFAGRVMYIEPFPFKQIEDQDFDKKIILRVNKVICRHESIMNGICQYCLVPISIRRYLFQAPGPTLSGRVLQQAEDHYIKRILQQKKAVLILDLDNTILHSMQRHQISQEDFQQMREYYLIPDAPPQIIMPRIVVKMRQNFGLFLKTIVHLYEIYIYTKGTRDYAEAVCECIRKQYKEILQHTQWFTPDKIFTRDQEPYTDKKKIQNILPTHRQCLIILDDRRDIWDIHYCIFVKQFFYFRKNKQQGRLQVVGKNDCYLLYAIKTLRDIHKHYFQLKRIQSQNIELSRIHAKYKSQLLKQYKVKYFLTGVTEGSIKLDDNNIYRRGKKIGLKAISENQRPNLIIRSSFVTKDWLGKISQDLKHYSQTLKIPVICENWIHACYEYTFSFPYHPFELEDPFTEQIQIQKFQQIIAQTANKLH